MPKKFNNEELVFKIRLLLKQKAGISAKAICHELLISQATFSRLMTKIPDVLKIGRARSLQYALRRKIADVGEVVPLYEIQKDGKETLLAKLHAVYPRGFYLEGVANSAQSKIYGDLPFFLDDLRPSGFLGRLIPRAHPELGLPHDIRSWTADHSLNYLVRLGWNEVGNFILGNQAFILHQKQTRLKQQDVSASEYPKLAQEILLKGNAGSSAEGEQPKFFVPERGLFVKFSPAVRDNLSQRVADLLVSEHLVHETLNEFGMNAISSKIVQENNQIFLEMERFDREGKGRRGIISLRAMNAEFVGKPGRWSEVCEALVGLRIISQEIHAKTMRVELFGQMIANTDMHEGNLSFYFENLKCGDLAPVYDMLPMHYAPQQNQLIEREWEWPLPLPEQKEDWIWAHQAALVFWGKIRMENRISKEFREIAAQNYKKGKALEI